MGIFILETLPGFLTNVISWGLFLVLENFFLFRKKINIKYYYIIVHICFFILCVLAAPRFPIELIFGIIPNYLVYLYYYKKKRKSSGASGEVSTLLKSCPFFILSATGLSQLDELKKVKITHFIEQHLLLNQSFTSRNILLIGIHQEFVRFQMVFYNKQDYYFFKEKCALSSEYFINESEKRAGFELDFVFSLME